jgi:hypothetical protein
MHVVKSINHRSIFNKVVNTVDSFTHLTAIDDMTSFTENHFFSQTLAAKLLEWVAARF